MFNRPESRESAPPGARKGVSNIQTPKLQQHTDTEATAHIDEELTGSGGCKFSNADKKGVETVEKKGTGRNTTMVCGEGGSRLLSRLLIDSITCKQKQRFVCGRTPLSPTAPAPVPHFSRSLSLSLNCEHSPSLCLHRTRTLSLSVSLSLSLSLLVSTTFARFLFCFLYFEARQASSIATSLCSTWRVGGHHAYVRTYSQCICVSVPTSSLWWVVFVWVCECAFIHAL